MFVSGLIAAAVSAAPAIAQQQPQTPQQQPPTAGERQEPRGAGQPAGYRRGANDNQFVAEMAMGSMAEVELGRMATQKAASADVKQFGERMVGDHGKALEQLKMMASDKKITLPPAVDAKHKAVQEKLSGLSGASFDRAYMEQMVLAHTETLGRLRSHAKNGQDADIKAWAAKTLPTVQEHLKMAQSISGRAVGTTGQQGSTPGKAPNNPSTPAPGNRPQDTTRPQETNR
jgi:putative membrane protein